MISTNFLTRFVFVTGLLASTHTTHAMEIKLDTKKLEADCLAVLRNFVPHLSYTGFAVAAGTAGICTSYNGFKRLCSGCEKKEFSKTGTFELFAGASTTALSIIIICELWR